LEYVKNGWRAAASPGEPKPLATLGDISYRNGILNDAVEYYQQALRIKPDYGCEERIAYIQAIEGNYGDALAWIDQFILMAPNNDNKGRGYWWKAIFNHISGRRGQNIRTCLSTGRMPTPESLSSWTPKPAWPRSYKLKNLPVS
jgi:tetratricopeptide (TPR) repeat protein